FFQAEDGIRDFHVTGVQTCALPICTGMEETYQLTSALKHLPWGKHVAVITDARLSGVTTGACIGHVGPEALAGGLIGRLRDGEEINIVIDRNTLERRISLVASDGRAFTPPEAEPLLSQRPPHPDLHAHAKLPDDSRLWAALQKAGGGVWNGCIYDVDRIVAVIEAGLGV